MKIVYAKANSNVFAAGIPVSISVGQHWRADDPVVKAYPEMFTDDARYGLSSTVPVPADEPAVEQATAAPGEKRTSVKRG